MVLNDTVCPHHKWPKTMQAGSYTRRRRNYGRIEIFHCLARCQVQSKGLFQRNQLVFCKLKSAGVNEIIQVSSACAILTGESRSPFTFSLLLMAASPTPYNFVLAQLYNNTKQNLQKVIFKDWFHHRDQRRAIAGSRWLVVAKCHTGGKRNQRTPMKDAQLHIGIWCTYDEGPDSQLCDSHMKKIFKNQTFLNKRTEDMGNREVFSSFYRFKAHLQKYHFSQDQKGRYQDAMHYL